MTPWVSVNTAVEETGLPRDYIMELIQAGDMPFIRRGSHVKVNTKLVNAYACRAAIKNAEYIKNELSYRPLSREKVKVNTRPSSGIRRVQP